MSSLYSASRAIFEQPGPIGFATAWYGGDAVVVKPYSRHDDDYFPLQRKGGRSLDDRLFLDHRRAMQQNEC